MIRCFLQISVLVIGAATVSGGVFADDQRGEPRAVHQVITSYIQPGFAEFSAQANHAPAALRHLCATPDEEALSNARTVFSSALEAFAFIEFVRVGPLSSDNRAERLFFWPDRRGLGLRQVQRALLDEDPSVQSAEALSQKSVALQGFGALEYLLFGTDSDQLASKDAGFRCGFALAVSMNIASIADRFLSDWDDPDGITKIWQEPAPDNPIFQTENEALGEVLGTLTQGLELIRDQRLAPILQVGDRSVNPRRALFWRSDMTFPVLKANFSGLRAIFEAADLEPLLPEDQKSLQRSVQFEFSNAERTLASLSGPVGQAVSDSDDQGKLNYLAILSDSLIKLLEERVASALDLPASFSLTDGD